MLQRGFLLIECGIALVVLGIIAGTYAWYTCHMQQIQMHSVALLECTTSMSNYLEQRSYAKIHKSDTETDGDRFMMTCEAINFLPAMTGLWATFMHDIPYRLMQCSAQTRTGESTKKEYVWYAGILQ